MAAVDPTPNKELWDCPISYGQGVISSRRIKWNSLMETYPENKLKGPAHHRRRTVSGNQRLGWQHQESNEGLTKEVIDPESTLRTI